MLAPKPPLQSPDRPPLRVDAWRGAWGRGKPDASSGWERRRPFARASALADDAERRGVRL
jgi:hypothetical protein